MAQGKRDENQVVVTTASFNGVPVSLKAEHATGYMKISPTFATLDVPTVDSANAGHDENHVRTSLALFGSTLKTLKARNSDGSLRIKLM